MFWMRAYPLQGQVGGGWALEFESFLGPVKWHRAVRRVPIGAQKTRILAHCFKLPKCEIFDLLFYSNRDPFWVGAPGNAKKLFIFKVKADILHFVF
jgi:hypothetical protein